MTEAQLRYGESLRYPIHHYLEDNPATPEQAAVAGYINDCKGHVLREIQGHPHMQNQVALVLQLPPSQRDLLFVHMANSHKRLQDNGAAIGLSSGEARVRFMYAVRNHRHNQPNNGNIIIDHESEIDELLAEENWKEMMKEMVMQGFAGEQVVEDINVLIDRRSKEMISMYGLEIPSIDEFKRRINLLYGVDTKNNRDVALNQYRGYITGAHIYKESFIPGYKAEKLLPDLYPAASNVALSKWFKGKKFPDVMEELMRYERHYPNAFNDEAAEDFLRDGFGSLLGIALIHTGTGYAGKGIAGTTDLSRYIIGHEALAVIPESLRRRMINTGIVEFVPKVKESLPKNDTGEIDVMKLRELPITNQFIARIFDGIKGDNNIAHFLEALPEQTKRQFIESFLHESYYENLRVYYNRNLRSEYDVSSNLPNRNKILIWLRAELENRGATLHAGLHRARSKPTYLRLGYTISSLDEAKAAVRKDDLRDETLNIPIYKRLEHMYRWQ